MASKFFRAVKKGSFATAGDLVAALELLTNTLFPENGIEYWSDNRYTKSGLKASSALPDVQQLSHVAAHVRDGHNEGRVIAVNFYFNDGSTKNLTWAKSFGNAEECWQIAQMLTEVLDSIILYSEVPVIIEMAQKPPRQYAWYRHTSLTEMVNLSVGVNSLQVSVGDLILDDLTFTELGEYAHFRVDAYLKDWVCVLSKMKAAHQVILPQEVSVADLLDYRFIPVGSSLIEGYRVAAPAEHDEADLGFFGSLNDAICAARLHQSTAPVTV